MTEAIVHLTPHRALRLVAEHGGQGKSAEQLRQEAESFERDAERRDRLAVSSLTGNRRKARQIAKARRAEQQRANAKLVSLAAAEVDRRKVRTVGQALRPWPLRLVYRITRNDQGLTRSERRRVTRHQRESAHPSAPLDNPHVQTENARVA